MSQPFTDEDHGDQADLLAPYGAACALVSEQAARVTPTLGPRVAATLRASRAVTWRSVRCRSCPAATPG